jgi:hypothetical protein
MRQQQQTQPTKTRQQQCTAPIDSFRALISPLINLRSQVTGQPYIEFYIKKKNGVVTLQWEPFEGSISQNGIGYLSLQQTIGQMPPYKMELPYILTYKSVRKSSFVVVDPSDSIQIKFYLDISGNGSDVNTNDTVSVPGGEISWITNNNY